MFLKLSLSLSFLSLSFAMDEFGGNLSLEKDVSQSSKSAFSVSNSDSEGKNDNSWWASERYMPEAEFGDPTETTEINLFKEFQNTDFSKIENLFPSQPYLPHDENGFNESRELNNFNSEDITNALNESLKNILNKIGKGEKFIAAMTLAGLGSHSLFHPFDTMKVRSQNKLEIIRSETKNTLSENFSKILQDPQALKNIVETLCDETKSLYAGYHAAVGRTVLKIIIGAYAIEHIPHLIKNELKKSGYDNVPNTVLFPLSALSVALAEVTLFCGLEKVKTHQMSTHEKVTVESIIKQHGIKALFKGFMPFLSKETVGKTFSSYANEFRKNDSDAFKKHLPKGWFNPIFATVQSIISTALLMPFDIFKTYAQKHDATKETFYERLSNITENGKKPLNLWLGGRYRLPAHIGINYAQSQILDQFGIEKKHKH